ncbi:MAG: hypothetical protein PHU42_02135 [Patescibacteria group bacterium]|nr:hypothetical protein [Patescibacteria group bacterium]
MVKKKRKLSHRKSTEKTKQKNTSCFCSCRNCLNKNWHAILFSLAIVFLFVIVIGPWGRLGSKAQSESFFPTDCFGSENADKAQGVSDGQVILLNNSSPALACKAFKKDEANINEKQDQRKIKSAKLKFVLENNNDTSPAQPSIYPGDPNPIFILKYSLDGKIWYKAGDIFAGDIAESLNIPLKFAYEIDQLQIALEPVINNSSDSPDIGIDSFSLEAVLEDVLTTEMLNSFKKIKVSKDKVFENPRSSFQAGENIEFVIKENIIPKDILEEKPVVEAPILNEKNEKIETTEQDISSENTNQTNPQIPTDSSNNLTPNNLTPTSEDNSSDNIDQISPAPSVSQEQPDQESVSLPAEEDTTAPTPTPDLAPAPATETPTIESLMPTEETPPPTPDLQITPSDANQSGEEQPAESESIKDQVLSFLRSISAYAQDLSPQVVTAYTTDMIGDVKMVSPVIDVVNGATKIVLPKPTESFRPGKYMLHIEIADGTGNLLISNQSFVWGVLAVNLDKTIYLSDETSYIQMGVLDDNGSTVCDANLQLEITDPDGIVSTLTTADGSIFYSTECGKDNVTDNPDYYAYFTTGSVGVYQMELTNLNNNYSISDSFRVGGSMPITVERAGATRINPFEANYKMTFKITASEDFSGTFEEQVPSTFEIVDPTINNDTPYISLNDFGGKKIISWDLNLSSGEEMALTYTYAAPKVSPQLYLLGPASAGSIFTETRSWQIASDAACQSNTTPMNWNTAGNWTCGHVPTSSDDVTIANGHVVTLDVSGTTIKSLTITGTSINTSLTFSGTNSLSITGNVTINQPTTDGIVNSWNINDGSASVGGNVSFVGTNINARVSQVVVTTGSLTTTGSIVFANNTTEADQVVSVTSGTITMNGAETFQAGTIQNITSAGTIIFGSTLAYGSATAGYDPIFTTMSGTLVKHGGNLTANADALIYNAGSTEEFTASCATGGTGANTFGNLKITSGTLTLNKSITVAGDWENNSGASALAGNFTVVMSGNSKVIKGNYSTTFYGLTIGDGANITINLDTTIGLGDLIFSATTAGNQSLTLNDATVDLLITGSGAIVTMNQPTGDNLISSFYINAGTATIDTDYISFVGTSTNARVSQIIVTSGSLTVANDINFANDITEANQVVSFTSGTITINGLQTFQAGTIQNITSAGTIIFNNVLDYGSVTAGYDPIFTTMSGETIKFGNDFTVRDNLVFDPGSTAEFIGNSYPRPFTGSITFGNFKITSGTITMTAGFTVAGDWTNNSSDSALTGNYVVTMNGASNVIDGTYSTPFYGLLITSSASAVANITLNTACSIGAGRLVITPGAYATTFTQASGIALTMSGAVTLNQPTAAVTSAWNINNGSAIVAGTITMAGTDATAGFVSAINITTGALTMGGITFAAGGAANKVISISGAGTAKISGIITNPTNATSSPGATSTWAFNSTTAGQSIPVAWGTAAAYANLQILNTNVSGAYPAAAITSTNVTGNITVGDDSDTAAIFKNNGVNIAGAGTASFIVKNSATFSMSGTTQTFPTGFGTYTFGATSTTIYNQTGAQTITAITTPGYGNLTLNPAGAPTYQLGASGGSFLMQGDLTIGNGTNAVVVSGTTNDPVITVAGNILINASATLAAPDAGGSTINLEGNWTNNGTFTHNNGIVVIKGISSGQTLSGTMTSASAFETLTITNNTGTDPDTDPSVIFSASATATTFNALTASTKIRFNAGSTYAFTNFNVNGQSSSTRVQLRSSSTPTQWILVASGSPVVYSTNAKDSDASSGSTINATDTSNLNGGNNFSWNFGDLFSDVVDSSGIHVVSPVYPLQSASLGFDCQSSTGTLGDSSQKIRVNNDSATKTWTLSIAATSGSSALWDTGSTTFDFNDSLGSGCTNGQLAINPTTATVTAKSGCTTTGINKGGLASFVQGSVDSITLLQSDSSAATGCYWDLTGAGLTQKIPVEQSIGNYSIDMTITAVTY